MVAQLRRVQPQGNLWFFYGMKGIGLKGQKRIAAKGSTNDVLKTLMENGCDYIFTIDDTVIVKDPLVYYHYIVASKKTGFECMMFAQSEPSQGNPLYIKDKYVDYWPLPGTGFVFYTRNALEKAGLIDENFPPDTWEDVELIHRIGNKGLTAPFGFFIGIKNEAKYFGLNKDKINENRLKVIARKAQYQAALDYWQSKDPERFPTMDEARPKDVVMEVKDGKGIL